MTDDEAAALNLRAYLALGGASVDWRQDLSALLRSDAPLDRLLRNRLADFVDNVSGTGIALDLAGYKEARDRFAGVAARHEWMEVGRWITHHSEGPLKRKGATKAAADHFTQGIKKVEAALTYFNKANLWVNQALESEAGKMLGRDWLERLYHMITVYPEMKPANGELLRQLGLSH